jgi:hypothetical protein
VRRRGAAHAGRFATAVAVALVTVSGPTGGLAADVPARCPGDPIDADEVITGSFPDALQGSYVMVPFEVPKGTTAVRVKYCYDEPDDPDATDHTLDLGLYGPRRSPDAEWGPDEFRGWGGSSHPDVTVSPRGFSTRAQYLDDPKGDVPGRTTRGFLPGPIEPGEWAAELGVAAVASTTDGDADGAVAWRLEIAFDDSTVAPRDRYRPAPYSAKPVRPDPGWYAGDLHVHAEHSALGDATMREAFDYAFRPIDRDGAGLDFITLTDYVTPAAWAEIGRYQARHPRHLVIRGSEVITYRGHAQNQASATYVDHRTGPVYALESDGSTTLIREARPAREIFEDVHAGGGWTQINHPTIFPSSNPAFEGLCRGCSWDYSANETDYDEVDAIELGTGPSSLGSGAAAGPNPFLLDALAFWKEILATGAKVSAVASSDSHTAGRTSDALGTPIGTPTTVVFAEELSERGVREAVLDGHTYVKLFGNAGPDLRFTAASGGAPDETAIIGGVVTGESVRFRARVTGATDAVVPPTGDYTLLVEQDGQPVQTFTLDGRTLDVRFDGNGAGRYHLELRRGPLVVAVTSPIYVEP